MRRFPRKQPLRLSAVYAAARHLMLSHTTTTIAQIEDYLIHRNYKVYRSELQNMMNTLKESEDWQCDYQGRYQFKRDTNEELETILQKGKKKIKVRVHGRKFLKIYLKEKNQEFQEYISNRQAMYDAENWLKEKLQEGYYCAI